MSRKHPIIAVTGSSGAGTTYVKSALEQIFNRQTINACVIEGDSYHSLTRDEFEQALQEAEGSGNHHFSHFGPEANDFNLIQDCFKQYGKSGTGKQRYYLHHEESAAMHNARLGCDKKSGEFTPWEDIPTNTDLLFYEGLHGLVVSEEHDIDVSRYVDLGVGVVPSVNLEWIQKINRDSQVRGHDPEKVVDSILRRMPAYVRYITPQFSKTDINFQRIPTVDTSNPFVGGDIPTDDESFIVISFTDPNKFGVDFSLLLNMLRDSFMSRSNTIVVRGSKLKMAMEVILGPIIEEMLRNSR